jgi:hypothetical protein
VSLNQCADASMAVKVAARARPVWSTAPLTPGAIGLDEVDAPVPIKRGLVQPIPLGGLIESSLSPPASSST